ncbi:MAG: hypothetical protein J0H82_16785 [Alphaproteobacteria bacterium]|jgi:hypothetical protein|nr:hypothetical protein [Alphaproteobacteria bacterium]
MMYFHLFVANLSLDFGHLFRSFLRVSGHENAVFVASLSLDIRQLRPQGAHLGGEHDRLGLDGAGRAQAAASVVWVMVTEPAAPS